MKDVDGGVEKNVKDELVKRRRLGLTTAAVVTVPSSLSAGTTEAVEEPVETTPVTSSSSGAVYTTSFSANFFKNPAQYVTRSASRIGLHMLREDGNPLMGCSMPQIPQEHFVINSCQVFIDLASREAMADGWLLVSPEKKQEVLESIPATIPLSSVHYTSKCWQDFYEEQGCSESIKADAARIMELISLKKEMGIITHDLPHVVAGQLSDSSCSLHRHIQMLMRSTALVRVGVVAARYVSAQYVVPWVVQSFRLLRSGKDKVEPFNVANAAASGDAQPPVEPENVDADEQLKEQTAQSSAVAPPPDAEEIQEGRRKRRAHPSGQPVAKKVKTVDTLGRE